MLLSTKVVGMKSRRTASGSSSRTRSRRRREQVFDRVLVSVGRKPNSRWPASTRRRSSRPARASSRSTRSAAPPSRRIFAIGDVAGEPMLAHKASHEGARRGRSHPRRRRRRSSRRRFPPSSSPIPSSPGRASPRPRRRSTGSKVEIAKFPWAASGRALTIDRTDGLTKLVIDPGPERVLGVGIVGPGAGELIAEGVLAVEMGAVATDLKLTIHAHPTLSETVMEAATVTIGISALRSVCLPTTRARPRPWRAPSARSPRAARRARTGGAHQHRGLEEAERHRGQEQRAHAGPEPVDQPSKPPERTQPSCTEKKRIRSRPDPERGHRDPELGDDHRQVVAAAPVVGGRVEAERDRRRDHEARRPAGSAAGSPAGG